jgi:hypothetical protein
VFLCSSIVINACLDAVQSISSSFQRFGVGMPDLTLRIKTGKSAQSCYFIKFFLLDFREKLPSNLPELRVPELQINNKHGISTPPCHSCQVKVLTH